MLTAMAKTAGLALSALVAGVAAGAWDQEAASLTWTLTILGGTSFLLSALAPRLAAAIVALLGSGVLVAHLLTAPGSDALAMQDGLIAAAVAALVAGLSGALGVGLAAALQGFGRRPEPGPAAGGEGRSRVRQRVQIDAGRPSA